MNEFALSLTYALTSSVALALVAWLLSVWRKDVSLVDSFWSLLILSAAVSYAVTSSPPLSTRAWLMLSLLTLWATRLAVYLTWRNHGQPEDRRYQQIRARNQPNFEFKSVYLVFGLQAVLAWLVSLSLLAGIRSDNTPNLLDVLGAVLMISGFLFETIADQQMARFKSEASNHGKVMDRGLWRYSRHPNYFGECCVWWGFYLLAVVGGGWWSILSPLLMTVLLLKVSGVTLLEADIAERRPAYRDYMLRTNAFIPWLPRERPRS